MLSTFKEFLPFLPYITAGGVVATLAPGIGPGRAIWIAIRSKLALVKPLSLRSRDIRLLKLMMSNHGQDYFVITGQKGIGKTCLVDTAISKTAGVIRIDADSGDTKDTIVKRALVALAKPPFKFMDPLKYAPRVIFWYKIFTLGYFPILIIKAAERKNIHDFADISGATRSLVEGFKLAVIVDDSPNSLDEYLLGTLRDRELAIQPMNKEMIWQMSQCQELFKRVKEAGLDETVFAVLGGVSANFERLWAKTRMQLIPREVIGTLLCAEIHAAIDTITGFCGSDKESITKLMGLFNESEGNSCCPWNEETHP